MKTVTANCVSWNLSQWIVCLVKIVTVYCVFRENCHSELCFMEVVAVNCFVKIVTVNCVFSWKLSQWICVLVKIVALNCVFSWKSSQWIVCFRENRRSEFSSKLPKWNVYFRENRRSELFSWKSSSELYSSENCRSELCVFVKIIKWLVFSLKIVAVKCVSWKSWQWTPCLNSGRKFIPLLYRVYCRIWLKFHISEVHLLLFRICEFRESRPREGFPLVFDVA